MIVKPTLVIVDVLIAGAEGGARNVVTGRVFDAVSPPLLWAITITLYSVFEFWPVTVVELDDVVGISEPPFRV